MTIGLPIGIGRWLRAPVGFDDPVSPRSVLRGDLFTLLAVAGSCALSAGVGTHLLDTDTHLRDFGGPSGIWAGLVVLVIVFLGSGAPWLLFTVTRLWLALWGRLPLRLGHLLEDAHRRGVLRQVGAVYQFRHARLQQFLGNEYLRSRPLTFINRVTLGTLHPPGTGRRIRTARRWQSALTACAVIAVPGAVVVWNLPSVQRDLAYAAERERDDDAAILVTLADEKQVDDPVLALRLRIAAAVIDPDDSATEMLRTHLRVLSRGLPALWVRGASVSAAGRWVLVLDDSGSLTAYEASGTIRPVFLRSGIRSVAVTPDARWAIALTDAGTVSAWALSGRLSDASEPWRIESSGKPVDRGSISDDGRWLVLEHPQSAYSVVDLGDPESEPISISHGGSVSEDAPLNAITRAMLVSHPDGHYEAWVITDAGPKRINFGADIDRETFAAADGLVGAISSSVDKRGRLWNPAVSDTPTELGSGVAGIDIADHANVFVRYEDGSIKRWTGTSGVSMPVPDQVISLWTSADNRWVFALTRQKVSRWYIPRPGANPVQFESISLSCEESRCVGTLAVGQKQSGEWLGGSWLGTHGSNRLATDGRSVFDLESDAPVASRAVPPDAYFPGPPSSSPDGRWIIIMQFNPRSESRPRYAGFGLTGGRIRQADFGFQPNHLAVVDGGRWVLLRNVLPTIATNPASTSTHNTGGLVAFWPPGTGRTDLTDDYAGNPVLDACRIVGSGLSPQEWPDGIDFEPTCLS